MSRPRKSVYLCGLIDPNRIDTLEWRKWANDTLREYFYVLDPTRNIDMLHDGVCLETNGMLSSKRSNQACLLQDFNDVLAVDVLLTNLNRYGSKRHLTGTIFELAWAWEHKIPVVGIYNEDEQMDKHPFVSEAVAEVFAGVDDAVDYLIKYYQ